MRLPRVRKASKRPTSVKSERFSGGLFFFALLKITGVDGILPITMIPEQTPGQERREFFRVHFKQPLEFKSYSAQKSAIAAQAPGQGVSQNISPSGILFRIENNPPELSSILWMNLDIRTLSICKEIERRALIHNDGLLGRVVRVEEDSEKENAYDIGVCFLTQDQQSSKEVEQILSQQGSK